MSKEPTRSCLRILSGTHAGATLALAPGAHTIGGDPDSDVCLSDWAFEPMVLNVEPDGACRASWRVAGKPQAQAMQDGSAYVFGSTTLWAGPESADWPGRSSLLASARQVHRRPRWFHVLGRRPRRGGRSWVSAVGAVAIGFGAVGGLVSALSTPRPPPQPTLEQVRASVQTKLDAVAPQSLEVQPWGDSLRVVGVVADAEQARKVGDALAGMPTSYPVLQRYMTAPNLLETIRAATGLDDAQISFRGQGDVLIVAAGAESASVRATVEQLAAEMKPVIRKLELRFASNAPAGAKLLDHTPMRSSWQTDDGIHVVETRDGAKHLVFSQIPDPGTAVAGTPEQPPGNPYSK